VRKPIIFLLFITSFLNAVVLGQDTIVRLLTSDLSITTKREEASFSADIVKKNKLWEATIYYGGGNLAGIGMFKDKNLTIRHGLFTFYYAATARKMYEVNYDENYQSGTWQSWHENGRLRDSGKLDDGKKTGFWTTWQANGKLASTGSYSNKYVFDIPGLEAKSPAAQRQIKFYHLQLRPDVKTGLWLTWHSNGKMKDSLFYQYNGHREGLAKSWYENGNVESAGVFLQDKETGTWEWYHPNNRPATLEQYINGKLNGMQCFDTSGKLTGDFCSLSKPALFPGGPLAFEEYLKNNLRFPASAGNQRGIVEMTVTIGPSGKPDEVAVTSSPSNYFSREAERLIYEMPVWEPSVSHNRLTKFPITVQLKFAPR
jgi:antitoxin component YwqK of YwqJK toxin-antitoxin module